MFIPDEINELMDHLRVCGPLAAHKLSIIVYTVFLGLFFILSHWFHVVLLIYNLGQI